ncbi:hypothetical protein H8K55_02545 [Undibacterium sp. LX15W]|uniref:Uncharacterized protein n=1 Tax=Undibacterium flavidum TaxID=2762297 RepID=A0ABR6Y785_9BURK|nr:hypothetical protein [Undibacterium flavidum]
MCKQLRTTEVKLRACIHHLHT